MNDSKEKELRDLMVRYINSLLLKKHILMRSTLDKYKFRLELGENLTPKEFAVLAKFLDRDSRMTKRELREYFDLIIEQKGNKKSINKSTDEASSLEDYFCDETETKGD
ncbi:MAG: hypothetical protein ACPGNW_08115 [Verrucomicrobiales bacterium]